MAGKYVGFDKLKAELAKRPGVNNPKALAASIGRKKYGTKKMAKAASSGSRITEDDPRWNPRTMGNHRGSKGSKTAPFGNGERRPT